MYKLGGLETSDMISARSYNHGERSMKIRRKFFRSLKRKLKILLDKQDYE